jgi:hypothetical protein
MPLRTIKYVQIQVAVTAAMIIFLHFVQSPQEIFWIPLAHYVTATNLKNGVSIYLVQYKKNSEFCLSLGGREMNNFLNYFLVPKTMSSPLVLEFSYVNDSFAVIGKLDNRSCLHAGHMLFAPST